MNKNNDTFMTFTAAGWFLVRIFWHKGSVSAGGCWKFRIEGGLFFTTRSWFGKLNEGDFNLKIVHPIVLNYKTKNTQYASNINLMFCW
jgi:hypothetical protein